MGESGKAKEALSAFLKYPSQSPWYRKNKEIAIGLMRQINAQLDTGKQ